MIVFSGGGVKVANNLAVTEEGFVLDARQGKVLDEKIITTESNLLKKIEASGRIGEGVDWNFLITAGVYKIQTVTMTAECHAPVGMYGFGTLMVFNATISENDIRIVQVYYPHIINYGGNEYVMATRTCNGNEWQPWYGVSGQPLE